MTQINQHKTGLALGAVMGIWHLLWALIVALGIAKPILDFILTLHFLNFNYEVRDFDALVALILVVGTSSIGYVMGFILASIWNGLARTA